MPRQDGSGGEAWIHAKSPQRSGRPVPAHRRRPSTWRLNAYPRLEQIRGFRPRRSRAPSRHVGARELAVIPRCWLSARERQGTSEAGFSSSTYCARSATAGQPTPHAAPVANARGVPRRTASAWSPRRQPDRAGQHWQKRLDQPAGGQRGAKADGDAGERDESALTHDHPRDGARLAPRPVARRFQRCAGSRCRTSPRRCR